MGENSGNFERERGKYLFDTLEVEKIINLNKFFLQTAGMLIKKSWVRLTGIHLQ